jgi:3-oxoacyl-[acyl-carrier-protein] synthase-3
VLIKCLQSLIIQIEQLVLFLEMVQELYYFEPNYEGLGFQDEYLRSDGIGREYLKIDAGGSILPPSKETLKTDNIMFFKTGKTVFKYAVTGMADVSEKIMQRNNLTKEDVIGWLHIKQTKELLMLRLTEWN